MVRRDIRILIDNKAKFLLCHSSTGHKHGLKEVLSDQMVAAKLSDTKAAGEVKAITNFYEMMKNESDRAVYGYKHVLYSQQRQAIQTLLLTDELFRACSIQKRRQYVELVEGTRTNGGEVRIFSALHVSGEQLKQLGGVAAILRFPLPELEDMENDDEELNGGGEGQELPPAAGSSPRPHS